MIGDIIIGILGSGAYDILKKTLNKIFSVDDEEIIKLYIAAIKATSIRFFDKYGDKYGTIESSFLSIEQNWEILLRSIFYGTEEIEGSNFIVSGIGIIKSEALIGAGKYVDMLHVEMSANWKLNKILTEKRQMNKIEKHINESAKFMNETKDDLSKIIDLSHVPSFPTKLVNQKIEDEINTLRRSRFFAEFDTVRASLALTRKLIDGELSGGADAERCQALAWCARFLGITKEMDKAEEYLEISRTLGSCLEIDIANAFICSMKGDKSAALSILADVDLPISRSAAFMIVYHHEGSEGAIGWLKAAGIGAADLDHDGKYFLLHWHLELACWDAALEVLDVLTDKDLVETPVLNHIIAITHLLTTVPIEFRSVVLNQIPFESADFPLASDVGAIHARRIAQRHFSDSAEIARKLNCPEAAAVDDEYALWLELRDPENSDKGRVRLEDKLRNYKLALRLVPLGLQFNIKLNLVAIEQEIERQIVLNGGITLDAAIARFTLAFTQNTPEDIANYLNRHYEDLIKYLDKKSILIFQVNMLSRAGLVERANKCLEFLLEVGLTEVEESRLRRIISEAEGTDPIVSRTAQFTQTGTLGDLVNLVDELETREQWDSLIDYGEVLFERTRSVSDAERLADALNKVDKYDRVVELIIANTELLEQSKKLHMLYCWSLYHEGALLLAHSELAKLNDGKNNANYRALQVNLAITMGDWNTLFTYVANEYLEKDNRSPLELIGVAKLAIHLNSPYAKELIYLAATKGNDVVIVLSTAYLLATNAGWEEDEEVFQWLHKAATLSGDDGPIQQMSLKDVLDRKPEWERRESETWQLLSRGEFPLFLAAHSLNKSLIDLMIFPALANLSESDPRRRGAISAYSGNRQSTQFDMFKNVGIDASALLTLAFLNLLDKAFDAFDEVRLPHSTLVWLFEEKQKAPFHQPSRIRGALHVRDLLATDILQKFHSSTVLDSDLSAQVGDELAMLIAEAEKVRDDDDTQRIVVRSYPVQRLSSLMDEEADLTEHFAVMSSCLSVVRKLRQKGQITAEEEKRACAYLEIHEKPWPQQPEINDRAILYLDDLTITYFLHLGILEKLQTAGFRPIVSPRFVKETNELISYDKISGKVDELIESIRSAVNLRIESGKIKLGKRHNITDLEEQSISDHPTVGITKLVNDCDVVIIDDRFLNQHAIIKDGRAQASVLSTLDLIDTLENINSISSDDRLEYRTLLRRAGYFFVPISEEELTTHLAVSLIKNDKVVETLELKAIRENILRIRMSNFLQLPKEVIWIDTTLKVFISVLQSLWMVGADISTINARANWILDQVDIRGWAQSFGVENGDNTVKTGRGIHILRLLTPPYDTTHDVKDAYWSWIEDKILTPIKEQYPDLYAWIVEWHRRQISDMVDTELPEVETT